MHHYGEMAVETKIYRNTFSILLKNHLTGAKITVSGPITGVFEDKEHILDQKTAKELGREIAHVLRRVLTKEKLEGDSPFLSK